MKTPLILITDPHGAQEITEIPGNDGLSVGNSLFRLRDTDNKNFLIMTGEELTSLSNQWLKFVKEKSLTRAGESDWLLLVKTNQ